MEEIWKDISNYNGKYQVSNLGNVSRVGKRVLKPQRRGHGYLSVWLYDGHNHGKQVSVHRLVAMAFIPNPNNFPEVNHIDENKQNNRADNLEWCSHGYNSTFGTKVERTARTNKNGKKSRAICQYSLSGELIAVFPSLQDAGRNWYSAGNICKCANQDPHYSHAYGYVWRYFS
jgi:hypothetical protein